MRKYMPFTYKMLVPYLLLVLITDMIIGYISYTMLIQSRTEMAETNVRTGMEQARNNIRYQMDEIQRMSDTLFSSLSFQRALQAKGEPYQIYLVMLDEIVPQITAPLKLFGNNIRLMLYTMNEDLNLVSGDDLEAPIEGSDYYILPLEEIENREWYRKYKDSELDNIWLQIDTDQRLGNISHIRKLVSYSDYKTIIGYIRITVSLDDLFGNFATFPVEEGITLRLNDNASGGTVIYQRGEAGLGAGEANYLILHEPIPGADFVIETLVPHAYLTKDTAKLQKSIFAVCALSFAGMSLIGSVVARISGRKMARIVRLVRSFQEGNFQKRIAFSGNDEFVHIAEAFNVMAGNIQELINSVYVQGLQRKQAELEALQAQINPHFLYNTLSTISSLANLGETRKVTDMVQGLSRFYRLTLNQGKVFTLLEHEVMQVETYLDIQRVKYADGFKVYVDIADDIKQVPVMKLILQPFVENIFKHAWFGESIAIRITGRRIADGIELKVIDNGIGMKPKIVKKLLSAPSLSGGYGVKNVDERIKLRYGEEYGISIFSIYGAGTTVRILLPAEDPILIDESGGQV
ncbi:sensor histidine kinase [Paenibacillus sp. Marseille-P2973]|uniref:sensor histidine kinase n=1 Tax=unclassified Paenibacillus TaxID=185978 RepID=UPI001B39A504|nr:sensor histidine kinase [Paenibacillus sp. Marseille-P2973]MBQ4901107.1 sensor histidine kinase [Paenibacillus sp. Marseille-P2973]